MTDLVGVRCPVPNCEGYVKDVSKDPNTVEYLCEYGHILEERDEHIGESTRVWMK